jgi:2-keto-3-deoxy-L-rhamnonate aldolase RhmA
LDAPSPPRFSTRLHGRETLVGTVVTVPGVALAELLAEPLDFVWIDLEHGALDAGDVPPLAVAARAAGCAALVRLTSADRVPAILDAGVDGVVAPRVESAAQARRLADRLRHPPRGSRGFAARRASGYGRAAAAQPDGAAPLDPLCIAQIESAAGVEAAEEIAAADGVEALVVGCADLTLALDGALGPTSPRVREAIAHVQGAAAAAGIVSGVAGPDDPELLLELAGARSTLLVCAADVRIYARAVDELVGRLRAREREALRVGA